MRHLYLAFLTVFNSNIANNTFAHLWEQEHANATYKHDIYPDKNNTRALLDLARLYRLQGRHNESIAAYDQLITLDPTNIVALFEAGNEHAQAHDLTQALTYYKRVLHYKSDLAGVFYNIAYVLRLLGKDHESIPYYKQTIILKPDHDQAHFGLSKALLATGEFEQGWEEFEWRWPEHQNYLQELDHHRLTLDMLAGKRILIRGEWGLGDTMHFIRYAKLLKDQGAFVITQIDPSLQKLFSLCPYIDKIIIEGDKSPVYDYQIPLLSLPRLFKTSLDTIPAPIPYLYADRHLIKLWQDRLSHDKNFKIGICWQSKPNIFLEEHPTTRRSVPLELFFEIARLPGVSVYCLQQKNGLEQLSLIPSGITIHTFDKDFDTTAGRYMDTAALMHSLDLIISVDTSIVHLSGAIDRPTWVLLPFVAEWRWLYDRHDTPWYPSMKLFRQPQPGDWHSVFEKLKHQIITLQRTKKEL